MRKSLMFFIIDVIFIAGAGLILFELNLFDIGFFAFISFIMLIPFIAYGGYKLIKNLIGGKSIVRGKVDINQLKYNFAKYILENYFLDVFIPNHIFGDKSKKSQYHYPIKVNSCYPVEGVEKFCLEVGDIIQEESLFENLPTKFIMYFDSDGVMKNDQTMNDLLGWNYALKADPLRFYILPPSKTEKAENILQKILSEEGEVPEELIAQALEKEIGKSAKSLVKV